jgi:hypothetical protein
MLVADEGVSNCCGESVMAGICSVCYEPCEVVDA